MINFSLIILFFFLGYFFCKKKQQIIVFIKSLKYFLTSYKSNSKRYNEFFECNFDKSDYVKEVDIDDV